MSSSMSTFHSGIFFFESNTNFYTYLSKYYFYQIIWYLFSKTSKDSLLNIQLSFLSSQSLLNNILYQITNFLVIYFFLLLNNKDCDCKKSFMAIYSLCIDVESLLIADTTGCFARARLYSSETRS